MVTFQAWSCSVDQALFSPPGPMHTCIHTCVHVDTLYVNLYRVCTHVHICVHVYLSAQGVLLHEHTVCIISCIGVALFSGSRLIALQFCMGTSSLVPRLSANCTVDQEEPGIHIYLVACSSPVFHLKWCNGHLLCCLSKLLGVVIMKPSKRVADKQRLPNDCCTSNRQKYESQEASFDCCPQEMVIKYGRFHGCCVMLAKRTTEF